MHQAFPKAVIVAKANAGIPYFENGQLVYDGTPEVMAGYALRAREAGARLLDVDPGHGPGRRLLEKLERGGLLLGVFPEASYETGEVGLDPGDFLAFVDPTFEEKPKLAPDVGPEQIAPLNPDVVILRSFGMTHYWLATAVRRSSSSNQPRTTSSTSGSGSSRPGPR